MDEPLVAGVVFWLIITAVYIAIFFIQYARQETGAERLVTLNVRTALFLPVYALFMFIGVAEPNALAAVNIPITFMEGYSFYCFYSMIVTNLGGPTKAVHAFKSSGKELACCKGCFPSDHLLFYKRTVWALWHFLFTRTFFMTLSAIGFYSKTKAGKALYAIFSLVSTVILAYAILHIVLFYENVYQPSSNLFGLVKAFLLKFSVGLIVIQGLVVQFMALLGTEPYNDDNDLSAEDKTIRGYCVLVLIEFIVLAVPYFYAFGCYKIVPREQTQSSGGVVAPHSLGSFFCNVWKLHDVFGYLTYRDDESTTAVLNA